MSDGKKDRKKDFRHDPFKRLKGFCVSATEKKEPASKPADVGTSAKDETALFAEEMNRLGVARRDKDFKVPEPEEPDTQANPIETAEGPPTDQELFLRSLGKMESVFTDDIPASEEQPASPRRMRQLRRGEIAPEAQLDLHGLSRDDAREKVRHFLDNSLYHGLKTVLIVTGKGKGSGGEPVLRAEIERYLRHEASAWVTEWWRAPARYGGEGALVVFLKRRMGK